MTAKSTPTAVPSAGHSGHRLRSLLAVLAAALLTACAGSGLRGHAPYVQVNGLQLEAQNLVLDLGLRNVNTESIEMTHIEMSIKLGDTPLAVYKAPRGLLLIANGSDQLRMEMPATAAGAALLEALENGEFNSLEYRIEGQILAAENVNMKLKQKGHLYPVPGRPGQFR